MALLPVGQLPHEGSLGAGRPAEAALCPALGEFGPAALSGGVSSHTLWKHTRARAHTHTGRVLGKSLEGGQTSGSF